MLANLIQLVTPRDPAAGSGYDLAFVRDVTVRRRPARNPRVERVLVWSWVLIAVKCWLVSWAIARYHVPVDPLWVILPTIVFAAICTAVYHWRS